MLGERDSRIIQGHDVDGTGYITVDAVDTAASDTINAAGYPYPSIEIWAVQDGDSVAFDSICILATLQPRGNTSPMTVASDVNRSKAWSKVRGAWTLLNYTAGDHEIISLSMPKIERIIVRAYNGASADNGTNSKLYFTLNLGP